MQKITSCLWFDGRAEEAMNHDLAVFKNARVLNMPRHADAGRAPRARSWALPSSLKAMLKMVKLDIALQKQDHQQG
ncbi:MAG: VOC family protein [Burkholderiaceae bacterium]